MKVKTIRIKNLRQIDEITTNFNGCTAIVTGGNNKGKSTLLKSIIERLRGNKTNIIKEGKKTGECERTFTEGSTLSRKLGEKSDKITYTTKDGLKTNGLKFICERLFGEGFDVDGFLSATPKKQEQIMQGLVGLDFEEIDKKYQEAYDDRTYKNKALNDRKSLIKEHEIEEPEREYTDLKNMNAKISEAEAHNSLYDKNKEQQETLTREIDKIEKEIELMNERLKQWKQDKKDADTRLENNEQININSVYDEVEKLSNQNKQIEKYEEYIAKKEQLKKYEDEAKKADDLVQSIRQEKQKMIEGAKLPEGFGFSDEGLTYNGFILDRSHLSSSQIYIAGLKLASMSIGQVETLTFDASYLDKHSLDEIQQRAEKKGLQLLIERPDFDGGDIKYEIIQ